jgi:hypothetical protein
MAVIVASEPADIFNGVYGLQRDRYPVLTGHFRFMKRCLLSFSSFLIAQVTAKAGVKLPPANSVSISFAEKTFPIVIVPLMRPKNEDNL